MITERAKASFERLIMSSLKTGIPVGGAAVTVEPIATLDRIGETKIVILTVSTYLFRLMAILYFKPDGATRAYFNRNAVEGVPELTDDDLYDRVGECGNVCCGSLNRDLGKHFPHVGMSTPNILDRHCMGYVDLLGCGLMKHYRIDVEGDLTMYASLCVADYGTVDFHVDPITEDDVSVGELELF
jgi:hypothetical protein